MTSRILWAGLSAEGSGRLWGYLENSEDNRIFGQYTFNKIYHTFWGKENGKIFYACVRADVDFVRKCKTKHKKYSKKLSKESEEYIKKEFSYDLMIKKLKAGP